MGISRSRRPGFIFLVLAAVASLVAVPARAEKDTGALRGQDEFKALGKSAVRLDNGMYLIQLSDGKTLMTHGPDPIPEHEGYLGSGGAERDPVCATDYYQHVLYGHMFFSPSRLEEVKGQIAASIRRMNFLLNQEAVESGRVNADFKVKCDAEAELQIDQFSSLGTEFDLVVESARSAGFNDPQANYSIFLDWVHPAFCGVGSLWEDESPGENNQNNQGGAYAVNYEGCWDDRTAMHENGHNMGATQYSAPDSTGSGHHCYDQYDVMCYTPDGGDKHQLDEEYDCWERMHYDCEHDTYFDTDPEEGEYLADHWNVGSQVNRFIEFGDEEVLPPPPPPDTDPLNPRFRPECINARCKFYNSTYDWEGNLNRFEWDLGDGSPISSAYAPVHTYSASGAYNVTLRAIDDEENVSSVTRTVYVFTSDPDPSVLTLGRSYYQQMSSDAAGTWTYFKMQVPSSGSVSAYLYTDCSLYFCLDREDEAMCALFDCRNYRVFLKKGSRPTEDSYDCASPSGWYGGCDIYSPVETGGVWYVGILSERAGAEGSFSTGYS